MKKPDGLRTKIFLDSADPRETEEAISVLGFLDGQTTNPTLITKNPGIKTQLENGEKIDEAQLLSFYEGVVQEISRLIPDGSVSVEVYSDVNTTSAEMFAQAKNFYSWIPNAHIKLPCTYEGFKTARLGTTEDIRVNMTLCFSQAQAAASHAATKGAKAGDVFISPFIGRLDDKEKNGLDLVQNIIHMYQEAGSHVQVLAASIRTMDHFIAALEMSADIVTVPLSILKNWAEAGMPIADGQVRFEHDGLSAIPYEELDLNLPIPSYSVTEINPLTLAGLQKFSDDWNGLISK